MTPAQPQQTPDPTQPEARPRCLIVGAGGHGRVVLDILCQAGLFEVVGFVDSNARLLGHRVDGVRVVGQPSDLARLREELDAHAAVVGIGDNGARRHLAEQLQNLGYTLINAIHPSANIARNASLGNNVVVAAGALVCAHCQIGDHVILNTGCIVDHESLVGTATHICPGARVAGRVVIEAGAFVGIGATIIQSLRVGYEAVVGAGAVVIQDVAPMTTVVGVPAREAKAFQSTMDLQAWAVPQALGRIAPTPAHVAQ